MALDPGEDIEARLEKLVEVALDADAEDFESEDLPDGTRSVEVRRATPISAFLCMLMLRLVQMPPYVTT